MRQTIKHAKARIRTHSWHIKGNGVIGANKFMVPYVCKKR